MMVSQIDFQKDWFAIFKVKGHSEGSYDKKNDIICGEQLILLQLS